MKANNPHYRVDQHLIYIKHTQQVSIEFLFMIDLQTACTSVYLSLHFGIAKTAFLYLLWWASDGKLDK